MREEKFQGLTTKGQQAALARTLLPAEGVRSSEKSAGCTGILDKPPSPTRNNFDNSRMGDRRGFFGAVRVVRHDFPSQHPSLNDLCWSTFPKFERGHREGATLWHHLFKAKNKGEILRGKEIFFANVRSSLEAGFRSNHFGTVRAAACQKVKSPSGGRTGLAETVGNHTTDSAPGNRASGTLVRNSWARTRVAWDQPSSPHQWSGARCSRQSYRRPLPQTRKEPRYCWGRVEGP